MRSLTVSLAALLAVSCVLMLRAPAAEPEAPPAPPEPPKVTRVEFGKDQELVAEFDAAARLTVKRGNVVLVRGGELRLAGETAQAGHEALAVEPLDEPAAWFLSGQSAPGELRARLRVLRAGEALALAWETNLRQPAAVAEHGYRVVLPAETHAGRTLRIGTAALMLPAEPPVDPKSAVLFSGPARALEFLHGGKVYLRILRDTPARVEVRDLRGAEPGAGGFAATFFAAPVKAGAPALGRFCLALSGDAAPVPPLIYHAELWPPTRPGGPLVAEFGLLAEFKSPFNPAEVAVDAAVSPPAGKPYRQPAFYAQDYRVMVVKPEAAKPAAGDAAAAPAPAPAAAAPVEREALIPLGEPGWRALLPADAAGKYAVRLEVSAPAGRAAAELRSVFLEQPPPPMGPLRPAVSAPGYLADPAGHGVFLVGHNLAWVIAPKPLQVWTEQLERMRKAGLNYARVWMASWSLSLETGRPYAYDMENAWRLSRVLDEAAARGIHVQLCLDNAHDFTKNRERTPYFAALPDGAGCRTPRDFFEGAVARAMYRARLRYLVGRFGGRPNLLAWELWNELDYCVDKGQPEELERARKEFLAPWARWAAGELSALDSRRHLVTCSLADAEVWPELCSAPELGLVESHLYLYMPKPGEEPRSERAALLAAAEGLAAFGKPALVSEFGFGADGGPKSPINEADRLGVHLHNGLWLTALSGQAGAAALWWWDSYLAAPGAGTGAGDKAPNPKEINGDDRYAHYRALTRFLEGTDWLAGWKPLAVEPAAAAAPDREIPVAGLRTDRAAMFWLQDPANNWHNRSIKGYRPERVVKAALALDGLVPGEYLVEWWDTYTGQTVTTSRQRASARGGLLLEAPAFTRDIAGKVRLLKPADQPGAGSRRDSP